MYIKPKLEAFGTFRELTQVGFRGSVDGVAVFGISGNSCDSFGIGCESNVTAS